MFHFLPCCVCGTWTGTNRFSYCLAACWRNCRSRWAGVKLSPLACQKGDLTNKILKIKNQQESITTEWCFVNLELRSQIFQSRDGSHRCLQEGWMDNRSVLATLFVDIHFWDLLDNSHWVWRNLTSDLNIGRDGSYICLYKFGHRFGGFHESFLFPFAFKHPGSNALKSVNFHGATARFSRHDFTNFHSRCNWDFYTLVN